MFKKVVSRGVSKAEWLEAGLHLLGTSSVAEISVLALAKQLRIAKSGFYWHFKDRADYLETLLDYWFNEIISVIAYNEQIGLLPPVDRLTTAIEMITKYDLVKYEVALHQWALIDNAADKVMRKANRIRLEFVQDILRELGFDEDQVEIRAMLAVSYQLWETPTFNNVVSKKRRKALIKKRIEFLTTK